MIKKPDSLKKPEIIIYFCEAALDGKSIDDIKHGIAAKFNARITRGNFEKLKLSCERILKAPTNFRYWYPKADELRSNLEEYIVSNELCEKC